MRRTALIMALLMLFVAGCGSDSPSGVQNTTPTTYEVSAAANWFVTSPDIDLSKYATAKIAVTFESNVTDLMNFSKPPQIQLWSEPDNYDFVQAGAVTINDQPSGVASPGSMFWYDLTIDLSNVPPNQVHIAIRPTENSIYGTLGPSKISVTSSTVTFLGTEHIKR